MKKIFLICCIALLQQVVAQKDFKKIHAKAILVDSHNDILSQAVDKGFVFDTDLKGKTHSDLARWKKGGLDVQLFSVFCDGAKKNPYGYANIQMDTLDAIILRNPDKILKVTNSKTLYQAVKEHKIAAMFGVEGGHMIEDDLNKIDSFYNRGARYMTLTWNNSTKWATSAFDETFNKNLTYKGLTDSGEMIIKRMNELGMLIDVSHVGEQTFWDVIEKSSKPIIASHSCVYTLCNHQRNLKDAQIKAIAKNGGVIQLNFYSGFLDSNYMKNKAKFIQNHKAENDSLAKTGMSEHVRNEYLFAAYPTETIAMHAPLSLLIQHIEYIINLVGIDYVGLGSDFDGIEAPPRELYDVSTYPLITKALLEKGYSKKDVNKILGGNFLRVLKANEK